MALTAQEILDEADEKYPNALTPASKVRKLNVLQGELFRTVLRKETSTTYGIVTDSAFYPLDFGVSKILNVLVDGEEYDHESIEDREAESPYYYMYENSVVLYPTPTEDVTAGLLLVHYFEPDIILESSLDVIPDFDPDFHMVLVYGLCVAMAEADQRYDLVNGFTIKYNGLLKDYKKANPETELPPVKVR